MPELPEVETIRRGLKKRVEGLKIVSFEKRDEKVVQFMPQDIIGKSIKSINRRAKILIFELSNGKIMLCHLKMTGQLIWEKNLGENVFYLRNNNQKSNPEHLPNKHTRAIFTFDNKSVLYFNDLRKFGYLKLSDNNSVLGSIGVEPFSEVFTVKYLTEKANRYPKRKIKQFLLDQTIIAGIGNIYADESLFYAGILPTRFVYSITKSEWQKIKINTVKALNIGLKYGGSSEENYLNAEGIAGAAHLYLKVYRKSGQKCPKCKSKIKRIVLGGRGTHFCPNCQK